MWFWYGFLTAIISAISITINKRVLTTVSTSLTSWSLFALNIPALALLAFSHGLPQVNRVFFTSILVSSLLFAVAKTISLLAIKQSLLSRIVPLNAFSAVFTYVVGLFLLSETIRFIPLIGLLIIILGAYILNVHGAGKNLLKPLKSLITHQQSRYYLIGVGLGGTAAVTDKIAVTNTFPSNPALALMAENIIITLLITGYLVRRKPGWLAELKTHFWKLTTASLVYSVAIVFVFAGFASGPAALVLGVKKLEIFFALLLSYLAFGDKPSKPALLASAVMIAGVILIRL